MRAVARSSICSRRVARLCRYRNQVGLVSVDHRCFWTALLEQACQSQASIAGVARSSAVADKPQRIHGRRLACQTLFRNKTAEATFRMVAKPIEPDTEEDWRQNSVPGSFRRSFAGSYSSPKPLHHPVRSSNACTALRPPRPCGLNEPNHLKSNWNSLSAKGECKEHRNYLSNTRTTLRAPTSIAIQATRRMGRYGTRT